MQEKVNVVTTVICQPEGMSSTDGQSPTGDFAKTIVVNRMRKELSSNRDRMTLIYLLASRGGDQSVALCGLSQSGASGPRMKCSYSCSSWSDDSASSGKLR